MLMPSTGDGDGVKIMFAGMIIRSDRRLTCVAGKASSWRGQHARMLIIIAWRKAGSETSGENRQRNHIVAMYVLTDNQWRHMLAYYQAKHPARIVSMAQCIGKQQHTAVCINCCAIGAIYQ